MCPFVARNHRSFPTNDFFLNQETPAIVASVQPKFKKVQSNSTSIGDVMISVLTSNPPSPGRLPSRSLSFQLLQSTERTHLCRPQSTAPTVGSSFSPDFVNIVNSTVNPEILKKYLITLIRLLVSILFQSLQLIPQRFHLVQHIRVQQLGSSPLHHRAAGLRRSVDLNSNSYWNWIE